MEDGACRWMDSDRPQYGIFPFQALLAGWSYVGVIYDVCNNYQIAAIDGFEAEVGGFGTAGPFSGRWRKDDEWMEMPRR